MKALLINESPHASADQEKNGLPEAEETVYTTFIR